MNRREELSEKKVELEKRVKGKGRVPSTESEGVNWRI